MTSRYTLYGDANIVRDCTIGRNANVVGFLDIQNGLRANLGTNNFTLVNGGTSLVSVTSSAATFNLPTTVNNSLVVGGDFTVWGNITSIDTVNMVVEDNYITLNKSANNTGPYGNVLISNTVGAGLEINTGGLGTGNSYFSAYANRYEFTNPFGTLGAIGDSANVWGIDQSLMKSSRVVFAHANLSDLGVGAVTANAGGSLESRDTLRLRYGGSGANLEAATVNSIIQVNTNGVDGSLKATTSTANGQLLIGADGGGFQVGNIVSDGTIQIQRYSANIFLSTGNSAVGSLLALNSTYKETISQNDLSNTSVYGTGSTVNTTSYNEMIFSANVNNTSASGNAAILFTNVSNGSLISYSYEQRGTSTDNYAIVAFRVKDNSIATGIQPVGMDQFGGTVVSAYGMGSTTGDIYAGISGVGANTVGQIHFTFKAPRPW